MHWSLFSAVLVASAVLVFIAVVSRLSGVAIRGLVVVRPFAEVSAISLTPGVFSADLGAVCSGDVLIGELEVRRPVQIQFVPSSAESNVSGNLIVVGSLTARLVGPRTYEIAMPCAVDVLKGSCFRTMVLVPGWDAPMRIEPGRYSVYLSGRCALEGSGEAEVKISLSLRAS